MIRVSNHAAKRTSALSLRTILARHEFRGTRPRLNTSIPLQPTHVRSNHNNDSRPVENVITKENATIAVPPGHAACTDPLAQQPRCFSSGHDNLDNFQAQLAAKFAQYPDYSLNSIYKAIRKLPEPTPRAWEIAFNMLIRYKRSQDAANILNKFLKQGFLAKDTTRAKMMSLALAKTLPDDMIVEELLAHLCVIVEEPEFTEKKFRGLLETFQGFGLDRSLVSVLINKFREGQGPDYVPNIKLIPHFAEALIRDGQVENALKMLENIPSRNTAASRKSISLAFTFMLFAFRDMYEWNSDLIDRIVRALEQHEVDLQIPTTLLLSWAVRQEKYKSVVELYNIIRSELILDAYVYSALFEMYISFKAIRRPARFEPLEFRRLFRNMYLTSRPSANAPPLIVPDTALLNTALTASVRQRDYAAALVILRMYPLSPVARLDPTSFYAVIQPLVHRIHADLTSKRRMRIRQTKWADHFLGAVYGSVAFSEELVTRVLEQVCRASFFVQDPLYAPTKAEALEANRQAALRQAIREPSRSPQFVPYSGVTLEELASRCGHVQYRIPSMQTMEMVHPQLAGDSDIEYDVVPLERLLRRAILAEIMISVKGNPAWAVRMTEDAIHKAEEQMMPGENK